MPVAGGPSAAEVPLTVWDQRTLAKTFRAIANETVPALAATSQPIVSERVRNPPSLREIASLNVPQWINGGPIVTFAQARASQWCEYDGVNKVFAPGYYPALGQDPRLLAQHLVKTAAPFDPSLVHAFTKMEPYQQTDLLRVLTLTAPGRGRCKKLMLQMPATKRGPYMMLLDPGTPRGRAACRDMMRPLSSPQRLLAGINAVHAGLSLAMVGDVMELGSVLHPVMWHLEEVALENPGLARDIAAGMTAETAQRLHGPFFTHSACNRLDLLFCKARALPELRKGRSCADVLQEWGRPVGKNMRYIAFGRDLQGLADYEQALGLKAAPLDQEVARDWETFITDAAASARDGVRVDRLVEKHHVRLPRLRVSLEMASIFGAAGRSVFAGSRSVDSAMTHYRLQERSARELLLAIADFGLHTRTRDEGLARLGPERAHERTALLDQYDAYITHMEPTVTQALRGILDALAR